MPEQPYEPLNQKVQSLAQERGESHWPSNSPDRPAGALQLYLQIKAFCQECVTDGDMTPTAAQMLLKILIDWGATKPNDVEE